MVAETKGNKECNLAVVDMEESEVEGRIVADEGAQSQV
jgi:hypothetical protein